VARFRSGGVRQVSAGGLWQAIPASGRRLPPSARLLAVMFADQDVWCLSQEALAAAGFGNSLRRVLRALVEAGFISKQAGAGERDLFGRIASRWRVIRTSNAYVFRDPQRRFEGVPASKSKNWSGTLTKFLPLSAAPPVDPG
jgi:hypothetical protein